MSPVYVINQITASLSRFLPTPHLPPPPRLVLAPSRAALPPAFLSLFPPPSSPSLSRLAFGVVFAPKLIGVAPHLPKQG